MSIFGRRRDATSDADLKALAERVEQQAAANVATAKRTHRLATRLLEQLQEEPEPTEADGA